MIRFIMKRRWRRDDEAGASGEQFVTFLADVPELEQHLRAGGKSQFGFDVTDLVGAEVVDEKTIQDK